MSVDYETLSDFAHEAARVKHSLRYMRKIEIYAL